MMAASTIQMGTLVEHPTTALQECVDAAQQGDRQALEEFVCGIERKVFVFAFRLTGDAGSAEDVTQEALLKICQSIRSYRRGNLWGWIYRIVVNQAHDRRRREERHVSLECEDIDLLQSEPEPSIERREQTRRVLDALRILTPLERAAVVLIDMEGLTSQEAAQAMGCLSITARSRAFYGRKKLRQYLVKYYPELREAL